MKLTKLQVRLLFFFLGNIILALGICINAKANLGVSAVMSLPFGLTELTGYPIGITSFVIYIIMLLCQLVLLGRQFPIVQWFQLLASFLSSFLLQIFDDLIQAPQFFLIKILYLLFGISLTALGASMTIASALVPGPPDGLANVIGQVLKKDFGFGKNILDMLCVATAIALGIFNGRGFLGIGFGTLIAVILTGRIISWIHIYNVKLLHIISQ